MSTTAYTVACDVSYFQNPVNDSYPHRWLIFRACDGTFRDPNFAVNYAWAVKATKRKIMRLGRRALEGFTVYAVYEPGIDIVAVVRAMVGSKPDPRLTVMIDVESWGGKIQGDHSAEINALAERFAEWLGDHRRVLVYANKWDFLAIHAHRPSWLHEIVAGYTAVQPDYPADAIGWQYSDGEQKYPVPSFDLDGDGLLDILPRASAPFGPCDHNVFRLSPTQLATALGVGTPAPPKHAQPQGVVLPSEFKTDDDLRAFVIATLADVKARQAIDAITTRQRGPVEQLVASGVYSALSGNTKGADGRWSALRHPLMTRAAKKIREKGSK